MFQIKINFVFLINFLNLSLKFLLGFYFLMVL